MPRVDPELLSDRTLVRLFIAFKLREARAVEALLTANGIDFAVLVEPAGRTLLGSSRNGAVFCVTDGQSAYCEDLLARAGHAAGIIPPERRMREPSAESPEPDREPEAGSREPR